MSNTQHAPAATGLAITILLFTGLPLRAQARLEVPDTDGMSWYKGNTHTPDQTTLEIGVAPLN